MGRDSQTGGHFEQTYFILYQYGGDIYTSPPITQYSLVDQWPQGLVLTEQEQFPALTFSQVGNVLNWQCVEQLHPGSAGWICLLGTSNTIPLGSIVHNQVELNYQFSPSQTLSISDAVDTEVPFIKPIITWPGNGEICPGELRVTGIAQPNLTISVYENELGCYWTNR